MEWYAVDLFELLQLVDDLVGTVDVNELERTALHGWEAQAEHSADITLSLKVNKIKDKLRNRMLISKNGKYAIIFNYRWVDDSFLETKHSLVDELGCQTPLNRFDIIT